MPCTYTGSIEGDRILALNENNAELSRALTETTQAACEMAKLLTHEQKVKLSTKTRIWINRHQKIDVKRRKGTIK